MLVTAPHIPPTTVPTPLTAAAGTAIIVSIQPLTNNAIIAINNNLTVLGNSDIHGLIDWDFDIPNGGHRPLTFVITKENSQNSIKESLFKENLMPRPLVLAIRSSSI